MRSALLRLTVALLLTGCASLPPPGQGMKLSYTPRAAVAEGGTGEAHLNTLASPHEPEAPERRYRRRNAQADSRGETESARRSATATRHAVLGVIGEMESSLGALAGSLPSFTARGQTHDVFSRYAMYGDTQLKWIHRALAGATSLTDVAVQVSEPEMEQGVLRMTGPRLQAAMFGTILLTAWADFLKLTDAVLRRCPFYSVERLFMDMARVKKLIEPSLAALASLEPGQVESAATAMPALMGQLTREFHSIREGARAATERGGQLMAAAQFVEMLTLASALKLSLPRLPPAAPATLGVGLMMGSNGVMMGTRMVVSAEWVERVRQLVQAGVFSAPVVSAAVRIHAGQVMMAQSNQELPRGVRDALGDGPEVRAMHETGRAGAGMAEPPRHHVLPREHREWFEKRGFTGDMNIDQFCVKMEGAHHQAIHGGGDWRKGRMWPGEWNQALMRDLLKAEATLGRMLTRNEVLSLVAKKMKDYKIPMSFTRWEGR